MRIALTGSHRTGKSTLARAFSAANPTFATTLEPYYHLQAAGYQFSQPLLLDDFAAQLEESLHQLSALGDSVLFDRCPLDFLAYLLCHHDARQFDFEAWFPRIRHSLRTLDLLVYIPIETPDRIAVPLSAEEKASRGAVDQALQGLLSSGVFSEVLTKVVTVRGSIEERLQALLF